jgi:hypothetical protein
MVLARDYLSTYIADSFAKFMLFGWLRLNFVLVLQLLAVSLSISPFSVHAEPKDKDQAFSFTFENDLFFGTDKYYTNGAQISVKNRKDERSDATKAILTNVCAFAGCDSDVFKQSEIRFGQLMYTPVNISNPLPQPTDRPWAGMLYLASDYEFLSKNKDVLTTITGQVGVIGPHSFADKTQTWIHKTFDAPKPLGWSNQIGGQLGLLIAIEKRYELNKISRNFSKKSDEIWANDDDIQVRTNGYWRFVGGNIMTNAGVGLKITVGKNLPSIVSYGNGPRDMNTASNVKIIDNIDLNAPVLQTIDDLKVEKEIQVKKQSTCGFKWLRCTAFATVETRLVARNVFLDGPMFRDGPSVRKKPLVADASIGLRLDFPETNNDVTGPWFVQFKATKRTPEFKSNKPLVAQTFGALTIGTDF